VGSVLWNLNSQFNVLFASRVINASKIYGPLGAVPVFLVGLYFSWLIMLFGAQVAYAVQNRRAYLQEKQAESVNQRGREFVALRLMANIGQRFVNGQKAPTATELADALDVPTRLIHQIAHTLVASGLLVEVAGAVVVAVPEMAYAPARPLEKITCHDILTALRAGQGQELATREEPAREEVRAQFERIQNSERDVSARITVFDLATKVPAA
jgi:membrane protein